MAPPASRRSKQNSSSSLPPVPLSGIAVGLFAAIAAGFAASRLRRKKPVHNLQDEQSAISAGASIPLLVQEREIEIKEKDDLKESTFLADSNGIIAIATHDPAKLAAGLKPVFDALEQTSLMQKNGANPVEEGWQQGKEEEEEEEEVVDKNGASTEAEEAVKGGKDEEDEEKEREKGVEDNEGKKAETLKSEEINEEEGETADATVMIEASLVIDEAFMDALDLGEKEEDEEQDEDDTGDTYQQPSPVLINGRILDFLEEMSDLKDDTDLLSSGSNSLSDAISESSMQEVSSAPVKPFNAEESMEASWTTEKPDFVSVSDQLGHEEALSESRNCSSLPYTENNLAEIEENLNPFEPDVDAGVTVTVEIEEKDFSTGKVNQIKLEVVSDFLNVRGDPAALQGEVSIKVNGLDEGFADSARINGKALSDDLPLPEQLSESEDIEKDERMLPAMEEGSDDITGLEFEEEASAASVRIDDNILSDDSLNGPSVLKVMATDELDGTVFEIHCGEPDLQEIREVSGENLSVNSQHAMHFESMEEVACMESDSSKELFNVDGISEELVLQSGGQDDKVIDGRSAVVHENSVDTVVHDQPSSCIASTEENTEDNELDFEASTGDSKLDCGRKDDDGLAKATIVEGRARAKQQEIEEIISDLINLNPASKKPASSTDSAHVLYNNTREVDHLVSKVTGHGVDLLVRKGAHKVSLQAKGRSLSRVLKYLPLEIAFICLLIALVSFVLWYMEVMPSLQS